MAVIASLLVAGSQACLRTEGEPEARSVASRSTGTDSMWGRLALLGNTYSTLASLPRAWGPLGQAAARHPDAAFMA